LTFSIRGDISGPQRFVQMSVLKSIVIRRRSRVLGPIRATKSLRARWAAKLIEKRYPDLEIVD
jgi:hypothetical protein